MDIHPSSTGAAPDTWPALPLDDWRDTYETLHLWTQIVGKVRTALNPPINHWWHSTLYVTARGLTTSPIPYGRGAFDVSFDFIDHNLLIQTSDGASKALGLFPRSVAEFYHEFMGALHALGVEEELQVRLGALPLVPLAERSSACSVGYTVRDDSFRAYWMCGTISSEEY